MTRFYVPHDFILKDMIHIRGQEAHHAKGVTVPEINDIGSFEDSLSYIKDYEFALMPCLYKDIEKLRDILKNVVVKSAIIYIGPEGDFTEDEIEMAKSSGAKPVSLGKEVLRSETAAISAPSILNYELRW